MNTISIPFLREQLDLLSRKFGLSALKTGTEVEDMSFEEISFLTGITRDIVPLFVKIGGPEARNDIRALAKIEVEGIVAPMVESAYALRKFVETIHDILPKYYRKNLMLGVNLETAQGLANLNEIINRPEASEIQRFTAARTDLSGSMDLPPDHPNVSAACKIIVENAREKGKETSVGGAIRSSSISMILKDIDPDQINTRHMVMESKVLSQDPELVLRKNLEFEILLYESMANVATEKSDSYKRRAAVIRTRLEKPPVTA